MIAPEHLQTGERRFEAAFLNPWNKSSMLSQPTVTRILTDSKKTAAAEKYAGTVFQRILQ
jgi:hypothetical protein